MVAVSRHLLQAYLCFIVGETFPIKLNDTIANAQMDQEKIVD